MGDGGRRTGTWTGRREASRSAEAECGQHHLRVRAGVDLTGRGQERHRCRQRRPKRIRQQRVNWESGMVSVAKPQAVAGLLGASGASGLATNRVQEKKGRRGPALWSQWGRQRLRHEYEYAAVAVGSCSQVAVRPTRVASCSSSWANSVDSEAAAATGQCEEGREEQGEEHGAALVVASHCRHDKGGQKRHQLEATHQNASSKLVRVVPRVRAWVRVRVRGAQGLLIDFALGGDAWSRTPAGTQRQCD